MVLREESTYHQMCDANLGSLGQNLKGPEITDVSEESEWNSPKDLSETAACEQTRNVSLLVVGEATTGHDGADEFLQELAVQRNRIHVSGDRDRQGTDTGVSDVVEEFALAQGGVRIGEPGILVQGADQALIDAVLGASGEWRLARKCVSRDTECEGKEKRKTYAHGVLGVLLHHDHLLSGQKAKETAVEGLVSLVDGGDVVLPGDASGTWEHLLHEFLVAAQLDGDGTGSHLGLTAVHATALVALDDVDSLGVTLKFDVAIAGLASRTLHDDVDGIERGSGRLADNTSLAADGGDNLILGGVVRELRMSLAGC